MQASTVIGVQVIVTGDSVTSALFQEAEDESALISMSYIVATVS